MRRTATEVINGLEIRVARLEMKISAKKDPHVKQVESTSLALIIREMNEVMSYVQNFDDGLTMNTERFIKKVLRGNIVYLEGLREVSIKSSVTLFHRELDVLGDYSSLSIHMFNQTVPVADVAPKFKLFLTDSDGNEAEEITFDLSSIRKINSAMKKWMSL
jgi:hypothetical protein